MCGIAGYCFKNYTKDKSLSIVQKIINSMNYRGPDSEGLYACDSTGLVLGHKRLSIQDTSTSGNQPFISKCGNFSMVFNGEIYNHLELRDNFLNKQNYNVSFDGHSDTETLFYLLINYDIDYILPFIDGMFSFAFYIKNQKKLFLARDSAGEKPLFIYSKGSDFAFSSDLNALLTITDIGNSILSTSVSSYLTFGYTVEPYTFYENIYKLPKSSFISIDLNSYSFSINKSVPYKTYSNFYYDASMSIKDVTDITHSLLKASISSRFSTSDVPVGTFLSGGVDSSLITALLSESIDRKVDSFSIGFEDPSIDESVYARNVSSYLNTNHTDLILTDLDALELIEVFFASMGEPFADSSIIPTMAVSKLASSSVKVVLSGDAGDEYFSGYNRYLSAENLYHRFVNHPLKRLYPLFKHVISIVNSVLNRVPSLYTPSFAKNYNKFIKLNSYLCADDILNFYKLSVSHFVKSSPLLNSAFTTTSFSQEMCLSSDLKNSFMTIDKNNYLVGDILRKVDLASMFFSLEARVPLLSNDLRSFSSSIPSSVHNFNGESKFILKSILGQYIPDSYFLRPKKGFTSPIAQYIKSNKTSLFDDLLLNQPNWESSFINQNIVAKSYKDLRLNKNSSNQKLLWDIAVLRAWSSKNNISDVVF